MSLHQSNRIYRDIQQVFMGYGRETANRFFDNKEYELYWLYYLPKSSHNLQNYILAKQKGNSHLGIIRLSFNPEYIDELVKYSEVPTYKIDEAKLNISTKFIIPDIFDDINIIWRWHSSRHFLNEENQYWFIVRKDNFYGIFDENGIEILPLKYDELSLLEYETGYVLSKQNSLQGILNLSTKEIIIPVKYDSISYSGNSFICSHNHKFGVLTPECKELIPFIYDDIQKVKIGFICRIGNKYGFINDEGETVIPFIYDEITIIKDIPILLLCSKDGKKGMLNEYGKEIIPVSYNEIISLGPDRICALENSSSNEYTIFSKDGEKIGTTLKFDEIVYQYKTIFKVRRKGKLGLISEDGRILENYTDDSMKVMRTYWEYLDLFKEIEKANLKNYQNGIKF